MATKRDPKQVFCKTVFSMGLKKALAERVLNAELDEHLDGEAAAGGRNRSIITATRSRRLAKNPGALLMG
jgi:transposase-like protein